MGLCSFLPEQTFFFKIILFFSQYISTSVASERINFYGFFSSSYILSLITLLITFLFLFFIYFAKLICNFELLELSYNQG